MAPEIRSGHEYLSMFIDLKTFIDVAKQLLRQRPNNHLEQRDKDIVSQQFDLVSSRFDDHVTGKKFYSLSQIRKDANTAASVIEYSVNFTFYLLDLYTENSKEYRASIKTYKTIVKKWKAVEKKRTFLCESHLTSVALATSC